MSAPGIGKGRYFRVMGNLWRHRKTERTSDAALGLLVRMWSFCADRGAAFVSHEGMRTLLRGDPNGQRKLKALLTDGWVDAVEGGYVPHDAEQHNPILRLVPPLADTPRPADDRSAPPRPAPAEPAVTGDVTGGVTGGVTRHVRNAPEQFQEVDPPLSRPMTQEEELRTPPPRTYASARVPERVREEPRQERQEPARAPLTDIDMQREFRAAFEKHQGTIPSLGGRRVGAFHADVLRTAELQSRDPRELYREVLAKFFGKGSLNAVEQQAPYACFHADWSRLTNPKPPRVEPPRYGPKRFVKPPPAEVDLPADFDYLGQMRKERERLQSYARPIGGKTASAS